MSQAVWVEHYPTDYLAEYYGSVLPDEQLALDFLVESLGRLRDPQDRALELGCGPTLHRALAAAARFERITLADLLPANLAAIRDWLERAPGRHDWSPFARHVLATELGRAPSGAEVAAREELLRGRVAALVPCDLLERQPLGPDGPVDFDTVLACFCLETIAGGMPVYERALANAVSLVRPGGSAIVMALQGCSHYQLGGRTIVCTPVQPADLDRGLRAAGCVDAHVESHRVPEHASQGYTGVVFARAAKRGG